MDDLPRLETEVPKLNHLGKGRVRRPKNHPPNTTNRHELPETVAAVAPQVVCAEAQPRRGRVAKVKVIRRDGASDLSSDTKHDPTADEPGNTSNISNNIPRKIGMSPLLGVTGMSELQDLLQRKKHGQSTDTPAPTTTSPVALGEEITLPPPSVPSPAKGSDDLHRPSPLRRRCPVEITVTADTTLSPPTIEKVPPSPKNSSAPNEQVTNTDHPTPLMAPELSLARPKVPPRSKSSGDLPRFKVPDVKPRRKPVPQPRPHKQTASQPSPAENNAPNCMRSIDDSSVGNIGIASVDGLSPTPPAVPPRSKSSGDLRRPNAPELRARRKPIPTPKLTKEEELKDNPTPRSPSAEKTPQQGSPRAFKKFPTVGEGTDPCIPRTQDKTNLQTTDRSSEETGEARTHNATNTQTAIVCPILEVGTNDGLQLTSAVVDFVNKTEAHLKENNRQIETIPVTLSTDIVKKFASITKPLVLLIPGLATSFAAQSMQSKINVKAGDHRVFLVFHPRPSDAQSVSLTTPERVISLPEGIGLAVHVVFDQNSGVVYNNQTNVQAMEELSKYLMETVQ